jgi:predicted Zn-dependent peptidase
MTVQSTTLGNGLRVLTDTVRTVETVSLGAWVDVGTRHERPEVNGVSHLLEHMAFKGTRRRSAQGIAEEIEAVGGHLNAYTSREQTAYYAKVLKEHTDLAVDIIADILQHSVMDDDELARERSVVLQEIHQAHDTPDDIIFDHFQETAVPGQAIGRPVLGTAERVRSLDRETLIGYMHEQYAAPRIVLSAAGNLEHDALVRMAEKAFTDLPPEGERRHEPFDYRGGDFRERRDLEQLHLVMGFKGLSYRDPDFYAAAVLSTLFGGGMSSRLFQEVRERRGLAYSVCSFTSSYADGGIFAVYAGTGEKDVAELVPVICDEVGKVCETVGEEELDRARAQLKAGVLMSLESTSARCEQQARQMLVYGRTIPTDEIVSKIDAVDAAAVNRVARRIVQSPPTLAALGPLGQLESFDVIRSRFA